MKIRKITAALSAAALLTAALPLTAGAVETQSYDNIRFGSWQAAYHTALSGLGKEQGFDFTDADELSGSRYELYDIDHDDVPELFASQNGGRSGRCLVYSFCNGKLSEPVELGTYGIAFADPNAHYLVHNDTHNGVLNRTYFKLEKGVFTKEVSFTDNTMLEGMEGVERVYQIDGKDVSETKYVQEKEKYDHMELLAHGRSEKSEALNVCKDYVIYSNFFDHYRVIGDNSLVKGIDIVIKDDINGVPVTSVDINAFKNDEKINSVTIGKNVTDVMEGAFAGAKNLKTVKFAGNPKSIAAGAFAGCTSLEKFEGMTEVGTYRIDDGIIYRSDMPDLVAYPSGRKDTYFTVPWGVQTIEPGAFKGNANIKTVVCQETVNTICEGAFSECPALGSVHVYNGEAQILNKETELTICNSYDKDKKVSTYTGNVIAYENSPVYNWAKERGVNVVICEGEYNKVTGDINYDGEVNAVDASRILAEYARTSSGKEKSFTFAQNRCGDIDKNDSVDAVDASKVLAYYAYTSTHLGAPSIEEFSNMAQ